MMNTWIKSTALASALCLSMSSAFAAGLNATLNTSQVAVGDSFQLTLSTSDQNGAAPDLSPLYADFDVLGTSQMDQTQIINGQRSSTRSWVITLSPKSMGKVTIPSLKAGGVSSDPGAIEVVDASKLPKSQGVQGISVTATIPDGPYYQFQEIPLTVRIESPVALQQAELIAPTGNFELSVTGEDQSSQITRNGQPITVVERTYLLRPQGDGTLTLPPFTLRGAVEDPSARGRDPFGGRDPFAMMNKMMAQMGGGMMNSPFDSMFNPGKPFVARSDALTLDVKAKPGGASDWFLPAKAVKIEAAWEPENPTFRVGEAVTRRVSLLALGARPEQLPNLTFADVDGLRVYTDDTDARLVETPDGTVAKKDFILSVVPTHGGEMTLPEVSVEWLNTGTGQTEKAILPAVTLKVEGPAPAAAQAPVSPAPEAKPAAAATTGNSIVADAPWLLWLAAGLGVFAAGGAGAVALLRRKRRNTGAATAAGSSVVTEPPVDALALAKSALKTNDAAKIYQALLTLRAEEAKSGPVSADLDQAIASLESQRYSTAPQTGTGDWRALVERALKSVGRGSGASTKKSALPELYPTA